MELQISKMHEATLVLVWVVRDLVQISDLLRIHQVFGHLDAEAKSVHRVVGEETLSLKYMNIKWWYHTETQPLSNGNEEPS